MNAQDIFAYCDQLSAVTIGEKNNAVARWADRFLFFGLILFALSLPHSIAATYVSLSLCAVSWLVRDFATYKFHVTRTSLDLPLWCFVGLTLLSTIFSVEPQTSWHKMRSLIIFAALYLLVSNINKKAIPVLLGVLVFSGVIGALFSCGEKIIGRGMIVTTIFSNSPLADSQLQPGDVIWMVNRQRVSSVTKANEILKQLPTGKIAEIEALHAGDPLPLEIKITDQLKVQPDPLSISVDGRSRRFRVSGFSRHFLTYAEQMQIFGLLLFGIILGRKERTKAGKSEGEKKREDISLKLPLSLSLSFPQSLLSLILFSLALILTSTRGVIAAFLCAIVITAIFTASRRLAIFIGLAALSLGGIATIALISTRTNNAVNFGDDSSARRVSYMKAGLKIIPQHPLLGVGMDSHKKHFNEWGFPGDYVTHTHSTPIQIAMERGLPALGCYLWLMVAMGLLAWRTYKKYNDGLSLGAFAALLGFFLSSLTNYNFGDSEVVLLLLFIFALVIKTRDGQPSLSVHHA